MTPAEIDALLAIAKEWLATGNASGRELDKICDAFIKQTREIAALKADAERKDAALESAETFIKRLRVPQNVAQAGWQVTQGAAVLNAIHATRAEKPY